MKTIRGTKVYMIMMAMVILSTSCVQTSSSSSKKNSSATVADSSSTTGENDSSDSGSSSSSTTQNDSGITYYDDEDEDEEELPGVAYSSCGVIYKQLNNENTFFRDSDGDTLIVQTYSYESTSILNKVQTNNDSYGDAYNACLEGYIDSGIVYLNTGTFSTETNNPSRSYQGSYAYEYCGYIAHTTYSSNRFTLLQMSSIDFKINNNTGRSYNQAIPTVGVKISSENSIEACVYSNKAFYSDHGSTFYRNIDAKVIDLGAYN